VKIDLAAQGRPLAFLSHETTMDAVNDCKRLVQAQTQAQGQVQAGV